jgi:hypothetical protein
VNVGSRLYHVGGQGVFDSERFKLKFTSTFDELRAELGFKIKAYVLMLEPVARGGRSLPSSAVFRGTQVLIRTGRTQDHNRAYVATSTPGGARRF